jgi:hypothetical protein
MSKRVLRCEVLVAARVWRYGNFVRQRLFIPVLQGVIELRRGN